MTRKQPDGATAATRHDNGRQPEPAPSKDNSHQPKRH
jgi:hypothetical protein